VLPFLDQTPGELSAALSTNCDHALHLALLMNFHRPQVDMIDLATTICQFSYRGDIRMKFKMENPDKVRNIVIGSFEGLKGLYGPGSDRMRRLQDEGVVSVGEEKDGEEVIVVSQAHS
jgi:hypothetical protein